MGLVDEIRVLLQDAVRLGVHLVVENILLLHGPESSEAHMERHMSNAYALSGNLRKKFLRKMQPRRRCSRRPFILCVHGLVAVLVLEFVGDIRRKRHLPELIENLLKDSVEIKPHDPITVVLHFGHGCQKHPFPEGNAVAHLSSFAGLGECFPRAVTESFKKQQLHMCPGLCCLRLFVAPAGNLSGKPLPEKSCGNDFRIINHEAIAGLKVFHNLGKHRVRQLSGLFVHHQKP